MESKKENEYKNSSSRDALRLLFYRYYTRLDRIGVKPKERGMRLQHAMWMCTRANNYEDVDKMNRWLGWVQGWLVVENIYGLNEVMEHTRSESNSSEKGFNNNAK